MADIYWNVSPREASDRIRNSFPQASWLQERAHGFDWHKETGWIPAEVPLPLTHSSTYPFGEECHIRTPVTGPWIKAQLSSLQSVPASWLEPNDQVHVLSESNEQITVWRVYPSIGSGTFRAAFLIKTETAANGNGNKPEQAQTEIATMSTQS